MLEKKSVPRIIFIPAQKGGIYKVYACKKCQNSKADLLPDEWLLKIQGSGEYTNDEVKRITTAVTSLKTKIKLLK